MKSLIAKYLKQRLDDSEDRKFRDWLSSDSSNRQQVEEFELIWRESRHLRPDYKPATQEAWQHFVAEISTVNSGPSLRWISGIAASLVLIGFLALFYLGNDVTKFVAREDIRSALELPDGSRVWLNRGSELRFKDEKNGRSIMLIGEGYFEVVPNADKPFTIQTGNLITKVLGTSFNVNASSKTSIEVVVASGQVLVLHKSDSISLEPGEKGSFDLKTQALTAGTNVDLNFDAWRTGILVFEDAPMLEVVQVLEDHFGVRLTVKASSEAKLNGLFDNQSLQEILEIIAISTDVEIAREDDGK